MYNQSACRACAIIWFPPPAHKKKLNQRREAIFPRSSINQWCLFQNTPLPTSVSQVVLPIFYLPLVILGNPSPHPLLACLLLLQKPCNHLDVRTNLFT